MAQNNNQDRPLIISEYGILMPEEYGYGWAEVEAFADATFTWLRTPYEEEPIGYPKDEMRLVQAWAWWPFDAKWTGNPPMELQAVLFDPESHALTSLGTWFLQYTKSLTDPYPGTIDLRIDSVLDSIAVPAPGGYVVTITAEIANAGALESGSFQVLFEIGSQTEGRTISNLLPGERASVQIPWDVQLGQTLSVVVTADPDDMVIECNPYNNLLATDLWVGNRATYLPVTSKAHNP